LVLEQRTKYDLITETCGDQNLMTYNHSLTYVEWDQYPSLQKLKNLLINLNFQGNSHLSWNIRDKARIMYISGRQLSHHKPVLWNWV